MRKLKRGLLFGTKCWYREDPLRVYSNLFCALFGIIANGLTILVRSYGIHEYKSSETTLEAEWEKSPWLGSGSYRCSNCHDTHSADYQGFGFRLGKYCQECGAKMKNPQYISIEYDYDD